MMSASFGSATLYINIAARSFLLEPRDHDGPRRFVFHDDDAFACLDRLGAIRGVGIERLDAAAYREHHLAHRTRPDLAADAADLADNPVVSHMAFLTDHR